MYVHTSEFTCRDKGRLRVRVILNLNFITTVSIASVYFGDFVFMQSVGSAATILIKGAERLKKSDSEKGSKQRGTPDFHFELLRLRSNWRLKKAGNTIIGDLSYKSSKCIFGLGRFD